MSAELGLIEILIGSAVVIMAVVVLWAPRLAAATSFLVFGVTLSGLWAVMGAPDIAVAEAALGTGITGALFIEAVTRRSAQPSPQRRIWPSVVAAIALGVAVVPLAFSLSSRRTGTGIAPHVADSLGESGVSHPITAVLLAFRAYDTLLEIAVLLLAVIVVGALRPPTTVTEVNSTLLGPFVVWLLPVLLITAGWLLFAGSSLPGGAFQAGAVLAGAIILVRITGVATVRQHWIRWGSAAGLLSFLALAAVGAGSGGWLVLPPTIAGPAIIALELVLCVSIAVSLALLVAAVGETSPSDTEVTT